MLGRTFRTSSRFAFAKPNYRPFGAGAFLNRYLGLKPQAESYCPFGAETEFFKEPFKVNAYGLRPWAILFSHFMACAANQEIRTLALCPLCLCGEIWI
jgi:hypothetical protein